MNDQRTTTASMDKKPLVTFVLFAYNQEEYIREAIDGALSQTYTPLEIIISDDCSTDKTFSIIEDLSKKYIGPHKVVINRNLTNLGLIAHIENITKMAKGELIIAAAGDDISMPNRADQIVKVYLASEKCLYIHSSAIKMDKNGNEFGKYEAVGLSNFDNLYRAASSRSLAIGATCAWSKSLIDKFHAIDNKIWAEDLIIGFRAAMMGQVKYIPEPLVKYRYQVGITSFTLSKEQARERNFRIRLQRLTDALQVKHFRATLLLVILVFDALLKLFVTRIIGLKARLID